ncbi:MAG: glycerol kinase GlpK [Clostridia bacterium]
MQRYIIAIDQGTSATKVLLFNEAGKLVQRVNAAHSQYYPKPGWVEQDASEIFDLTCNAIKQVISASVTDPESIVALSITTQTGAFVVWEKSTGNPVYHVIGWQCNRGDIAGITEDQAKHILEKSGMVPTDYSVASKVKWMMENIEGLHERAENGELLFGTIECFLIWKLTQGKVHAADYCNAGNTQLLNVKTLSWDDELLRIYRVPKCMMPQLKNADADFGEIEVEGLPHVPITGIMGDSAAALFAQGGFDRGDVKITYGTGSSILFNLGAEAKPSVKCMTTTVGWRMGDDETTYVWEGTMNYTGDIILWLVNEAGLLNSAAESEKIAESIKSSDGVYFIPAFNGMDLPYQNSQARTCITGISRNSTRAHIVRAALECIAYKMKDMIEAALQNTEGDISCIFVDGGVARNNFLMQFQADILNIPIIRSELEECSALGAFYMAGLATGLFKDRSVVKQMRYRQKEFLPRMEKQERAALYAGWKKAVNMLVSARN